MSEFAGPSLELVIQNMIDAALRRVNTIMPAKVVAVDVAAATCDVQPVLKRTNSNGEVLDLPVITSVPIAVYRAGKAFISLPVKVGDYVELRFSQRSLDSWLVSGGVIDPKDKRMFQLSDAIAYPGIYPFDDPPVGASADDIIIKNDKSLLTIKPNGKFLIAGEGEELFDLVIQLAEQVMAIAATLATTTTNTALGPQPLLDAANFGSDAANVDTIIDKLTGIKG